MSRSAELAALIRDCAGQEAPEYGLILGSGLGRLSACVDGVAIPMTTCQAFPMQACRAMSPAGHRPAGGRGSRSSGAVALL
ncbi:hypothetical protein FLP41_06185 [Paracoccus marcusii]|uniref:hypothetical protein n=1 Tax=Paracoccus marcusii TaxID=59779 RepID=UPI002ECFDAD6|nr:hypothetical protein FLP41_06185 [Paracoccus marcusii]